MNRQQVLEQTADVKILLSKMICCGNCKHNQSLEAVDGLCKPVAENGNCKYYQFWELWEC